jgi:hypothetical protein
VPAGDLGEQGPDDERREGRVRVGVELCNIFVFRVFFFRAEFFFLSGLSFFLFRLLSFSLSPSFSPS